jgi:hypothetical protein
MSDEDKIKWFEQATQFQLEGMIFIVMKSRKDGVGSWAVQNMETKEVLNSNMEWEPEPPKAQRDEAFMIRARFDRDTAFVMFEQYKMFAEAA